MGDVRLEYVETEGGPFVLLPMELKKAWKGTGDEEDDGREASDYERAEEFLSTVGVLDVGEGKVLVLGEAEVTAFRPTPDGGVFVQRVYGDEDAGVIAAVDEALRSAEWEKSGLVLPIAGRGKLWLFDSARSYADADQDEVLQVALAPGRYAVETARVKTDDVEAGLVRLRRAP